MAGALEGIRVLDLTTELWSSLAAALLGDFGADVIRIETLPAEPGPRADLEPETEDACWDHQSGLAQRNKRSLCLDPRSPAGAEILAALIDRADVFLSDWPEAQLAEIGCDFETLGARKGDLIYAHGSGFGPRGPDRDLPALDELAAARTGMMPILPQPGEPPVYPDAGRMYTTVMLAFGVMTALHHRQRTGEGQRVDASLLGGNMYGASLDLQAFLAIGGQRFLEPVSRLDAGNPMSGTIYLSKDGRWVTLTMPDTDRWWPALAEITGLDPADPRFDSHERRCGEGRLELMRVLEEAFARHPADHWRQAFLDRQLSADIIEDYTYPANDEDARRNDYILEVEQPDGSTALSLGFPIYLSDAPAALYRPAPRPGQDSDEILREQLGYDAQRIAELRANGVLA